MHHLGSHMISRRKVLAAGAVGAAGAATLGLAGCGDDEGDSGSDKLADKRVGAMDDYKVGTTFKATKPLKFSIMMFSNPAYEYKADWPMWAELTKRTNVSFDPVVVPASDYNQKRSVMISGGQAPFIIPKVYPPDEEQYVAGGAILPISDYIDYMPNFKDQVEKWNLKGDLDQRRQEDGKFYILPGLHQHVWLDYTLLVRTDILQKLNIPTPQTWDDVYNMLKKMRESNPATDFYPFSDRFSTPPQPGANNLLGILSSAYGTKAAWNWAGSIFDKSADKFVYPGAQSQYKDMLTFVHKLVEEKLLDPESFTQQDDQARQKFARGKSYVISGNAQTLVNETRVDAKSVPGATVAKIPLPVGPMGNTLEGTRLENGVIISSKAKDSENFVAMLQFIDWLWYSDEGKLFAKWGIEGETYTGKVDDGSFKLSPNVTFGGINPNAPKKLQVDYGFYNGVFVYGGSDALMNTQFSDEEKEYQKNLNQRQPRELDPPHPLSAEEREAAALKESGLKDYQFQNDLKFALGQRPLSEWDKYVSELKGKGMDDYIKTINDAYDRYKEKNK